MSNILEIILKAVKSGSGFKDTEKDTTSLSKAVAGLNKILGAAGLALGAKELFEFGQASVAAARESAAAEAELQAALTSTGQASAEYKAQLEGLATALENTSLFSDETIQKAEATLVTFKNLGQDIMPRTIQTVADMGQKMGDMGAAAQLAGIALNAPEQAAARLQRQGIMLTQQQKEQIDTMVQVGNVAGAQGIILDALNTKFGGQAQAARDAAGGAQDYAVSLGRLQEAFGGLLLTIGDAGATDAAVGWIDRLAAGATAWTGVIENIRLLSEAEAKLAEESGKVEIAQRGALGQVAGSEEAYANAESALSSLIGWFVEGSTAQEGFAEAVQEVAGSTEEFATVVGNTPARINPALRAVQVYADTIRDLTAAQQENLNAPQTNREVDAYRQMAMGRVGMQDAVLQMENEQAQRAADEKRAQEKEAARASEQIFKESTQAMVDATSELGNQISSAVSGAITGVNQDVIGQLLGIEGAEANAGEAVRRMAAVAAGGIQNEWAPALAQQLTGVQDATAQAFVQAFQAGDSGALQGAARQLALNPIVDMFDANLIAQQVEQKLRAQQLTQQLNDKVNALLGEKGLPAVAAVSQQIGQAATDTGTATAQVQQGTTDMAASAEAAGAKMQTSFDGAIAQINVAITRLQLAIGLTERWGVVAQETAGKFNALNPPAAPGAGNGQVVTDAQRKMGGMTAL